MTVKAAMCTSIRYIEGTQSVQRLPSLLTVQIADLSVAVLMAGSMA